MGWSHGIDTRRAEGDQDIGYGVEAECDHPDCHVKIDRGLAFVCGGNPFGEPHGCGRFFCQLHLVHDEVDGDAVQLCHECQAANHPWVHWLDPASSWGVCGCHEEPA